MAKNYEVDLFGAPEPVTIVSNSELPRKAKYKGTFFAGEDNGKIYPTPDTDIDIFYYDDKVYGVI